MMGGLARPRQAEASEEPMTKLVQPVHAAAPMCKLRLLEQAFLSTPRRVGGSSLVINVLDLGVLV